MSKPAIKRLLFIIILLVHVACVLDSFPPRLCSASEPPIGGDTAHYYASTMSTVYTGRSWGYDPMNMAGYPHGLWNSMGKKGYELCHRVLPMIPLPMLLYLIYVFFGLITPLVTWAAVRWACDDKDFVPEAILTHTDAPGKKRWSSWLSLTLLSSCILMWHFSTWITYIWTFGSIFYSTSAYLMVVVLALAWKSTKAGFAPVLGIVLGLAVGLIFYLHTVILVAGIVPLALLLLYRLKGENRKPVLLTIGVSWLVFFVVILPWLIPLLTNSAEVSPQSRGAWFLGSLDRLYVNLMTDRFAGQAYDRTADFQAWLLLGLFGAGIAWSKRTILPVLAVVGALACLGMTGLGQYLSWTRNIQPYRFFVPCSALMLIPGTAGIWLAGHYLQKTDRYGRILCVLLLLFCFPRFYPYAMEKWEQQLPRGLTAQQDAVIEAIRKLPAEGRLLCDDMEIGLITPGMTGRPVLGGLSAQAFIDHRFAGINENGVIFGMPANEMSAELFSNYLDSFAVRYCYFMQPDLKALAERAADLLIPIETIGDGILYQVRKPVNYAGNLARVEVHPDQLVITQAQSSSLFLAFRYAPWMRASQGATIEPVKVLDDPIPHIQVTLPEGVHDCIISIQPE